MLLSHTDSWMHSATHTANKEHMLKEAVILLLALTPPLPLPLSHAHTLNVYFKMNLNSSHLSISNKLLNMIVN